MTSEIPNRFANCEAGSDQIIKFEATDTLTWHKDAPSLSLRAALARIWIHIAFGRPVIGLGVIFTRTVMTGDVFPLV